MKISRFVGCPALHRRAVRPKGSTSNRKRQRQTMAAAADAERLWSDLDAHERELRREGYQLREIWHKTTELHAENEKARSELEGKARQNFVAPDTRINLNVGGQIFETTAGILC